MDECKPLPPASAAAFPAAPAASQYPPAPAAAAAPTSSYHYPTGSAGDPAPSVGRSMMGDLLARSRADAVGRCRLPL